MSNLRTLTHKLFVARQEAAANNTFSDALATAGDFANKPSPTVDLLDLIRMDPNAPSQADPVHFAETIVNGLEFYFMGGNADDDIFAWKIYAWRNENGPAELAANGTGILGSQAVVIYPHNGLAASNKFWADTLVVSNDRWQKEVEATSVGGNSVSKVWLDICGRRYWYIEIPSSVGHMAVYLGYW